MTEYDKPHPTPESAAAVAEHVPHALGHVVSARVLLGVWALLIVLTVVTVLATRVDLGAYNLWLAMGIAAVKAAFVLLYFMHLRYDRPINAMWFIFGLFFVALFIAGSLTDTEQYQPDLIPGYAPDMNR